jgi:integrase
MVFNTCWHVTWRTRGRTALRCARKEFHPTCFATPLRWNCYRAGVDRAVIALWLGHESVETTQIYLDADLALKEQALARTNPVKGASKRFQPDDELLAFLKQL